MTRAIITCFHLYQNYGKEYYQPILDFYLQSMKKYKDEYDQLYLVDSNWEIPKSSAYKVLKVNPNLRYYDAYKEVLPQIKEDLVLFMDNDMMVYRKRIIKEVFDALQEFPVISIYDTIGEKKDFRLNLKSKWCLYWFATIKDILMKYRDCEWGPVAWGETLSELTFKMLDDGIQSFEWEEDKSSIYFDGTKDGEHSKNLGYYHIRAGSVPALLLAYKKHDPDKYWEYLKNQPKREYLRQCMWYQYMGGNVAEILIDVNVTHKNWLEYMSKFIEYHGL